METRRRANATPSYGEKEVNMGLGEKELLQHQQVVDDGDSGKWGKGYGEGPGLGGRRGLPPRQKRAPGWVSRGDEDWLGTHEVERIRCRT